MKKMKRGTMTMKMKRGKGTMMMMMKRGTTTLLYICQLVSLYINSLQRKANFIIVGIVVIFIFYCVEELFRMLNKYSKMNPWLQSAFLVCLVLATAVSADRLQTFPGFPTQIQRLDIGNLFSSAPSQTDCEQERSNCIDKCTEENMIFRCSSLPGFASTCTCTTPSSLASSDKNESLRCRISRTQCEQTCGPNPNFQCSDSGSTISQSCSCSHVSNTLLKGADLDIPPQIEQEGQGQNVNKTTSIELFQNSNVSETVLVGSEAVSKVVVDENLSGNQTNAVNASDLNLVQVQIHADDYRYHLVDASKNGTNVAFLQFFGEAEESESLPLSLDQVTNGTFDAQAVAQVNGTVVDTISVPISVGTGVVEIVNVEPLADEDDIIDVIDGTDVNMNGTIQSVVVETIEEDTKKSDNNDTLKDDGNQDDLISVVNATGLVQSSNNTKETIEVTKNKLVKNDDDEDDDEDEEGDDDDEDEEGEGDDDDDDEEGDDDDEDEEGDDDDEDEEGEGDDDDDDEEGDDDDEDEEGDDDDDEDDDEEEDDDDLNEQQSTSNSSKNSTLDAKCEKAKTDCQTKCKNMEIDFDCQSNDGAFTQSCACVSKNQKSSSSPSVPESPTPTPTSTPTPTAEIVMIPSASLSPKVINKTSNTVIVSAAVLPTTTDSENATLGVPEILVQNATLDTSKNVSSDFDQVDVVSITDQEILECKSAAENCRLMCGNMKPKFECDQILNVISQSCSCSSADVLTKSDSTQMMYAADFDENVQNATVVTQKSTATSNVTSSVSSNKTAEAIVTNEVSDGPLNEASVNNIFSPKQPTGNNLLNNNNMVLKSQLGKKFAVEPECEQAKKECEMTCKNMEVEFDCKKVGINFAKSCACVSNNVDANNLNVVSGAHADIAESMRSRMSEILKMQNEP
eukprot:TRINITY_DN371_c0_g1_i3.p1 TRINITY_DN371_c0_g1~~TRINITY_DN371_c0_g1_i3.p1  ORF type:complete len:909 (-),score=240.79 TRINITY_DN371_c0_g1_i3:833-3559(-)